LDRGLTVFNPGSVGPRRFELPIVLGSIDVAHGAVKLAHIDCETGAVWSPPGLGVRSPSSGARVLRG
jgi:hypothetical protein